MAHCNDYTCTAGDAPATHLYARRAVQLDLPPSTAAYALLPFFLTYVVVAFLAWRKLFPLLSGNSPKPTHVLDSPISRRAFGFSRSRLKTLIRFAWDRAAAITFSTTIALSALLAELIFCEITDVFEPAARKLALEATISILLVSLVIVTPALEIHSITTATGVRDGSKAKLLLATFIDILGLGVWLFAFWAIGQAVLGSNVFQKEDYLNISKWSLRPSWLQVEQSSRGISQGSLERIGIIGISLMASLAGFAAVSSIWQTFGARLRKVTETDLTRKQAGLEATTDLLNIKESRLRALERKMSYNNPPQRLSLVTRLVGSLRPDADNQEYFSLRLEIAGLKTMQASLSNSLNILRARRATQQQASTPFGRLCITTSYVFSIYCLYRICATSLATFRRWWHPHASFASTDPINNALALIAKLWDPDLDRVAWSRQISFLLSGVMLLASFNAVLQTVLLFSRFTPARLLASAQQNLALLASQICATYVVSSALLLRSNLPQEMGSVIEGALGAPLDVGFVERWFEGWFLTICALTALGIFVSRKIVGSVDWDDAYEDDGDLEAGKRLS